MKNIKITTKYIQAITIILMVVVFSVASPLVVSAQFDYTYDSTSYGGTNSFGGVDYTYNGPTNSDGYYSSGGIDYTYNPISNGGINSSGGIDYTYNPVSNGGINSSGGIDYTYNPISNGGINSSGGIDYAFNPINNGGYYLGGTNGGTLYAGVGVSYPGGGSYTGYYGGSYYGGVASGGYLGGVSTYTGPGNYSSPTIPTTSSGTFLAGTSTYTGPGVYDVSTIQTVTSGGYSGGNGNYINPTTYYNPPAPTTGSGIYSGVTLTSQKLPNQVLSYTDTSPSLDSVYLSDIPSTGFEDYYKTIIFISILVSWSAILAYIFLSRKIKSQIVPAIVNANKIEISDSDVSVSSNLLNKIASDNSDISKVEEYARMNKVLLSSDASVKLVKLSRLGNINISEYIRSIAKGEWVAIGENQIV